MLNWVAVASSEHVQKGRLSGFMQVCHGKGVPLRRMKPNDWVVYYSPTVTFGRLQQPKKFLNASLNCRIAICFNAS